MHWAYQVGRSRVAAITGDPSTYTVSLLEIDEADDMFEGFLAFWERILTEGPKCWSKEWEILLIEFWTDAGLFNAVFTTMDRRHDSPFIYKLTSAVLLADYDALPDPAVDVCGFQREHGRLQDRYWQMLTDAAAEAPIAQLIRDIRKMRPMPIWGTLCHFVDTMHELDI